MCQLSIVSDSLDRPSGRSGAFLLTRLVASYCLSHLAFSGSCSASALRSAAESFNHAFCSLVENWAFSISSAVGAKVGFPSTDDALTLPLLFDGVALNFVSLAVSVLIALGPNAIALAACHGLPSVLPSEIAYAPRQVFCI